MTATTANVTATAALLHKVRADASELGLAEVSEPLLEGVVVEEEEEEGDLELEPVDDEVD